MTPGMNMMNMFSMGGYGNFGGSYNNFFTDCNGNMNTNAMLGYGLTTMGLNLGMSIFNCYWGGGAGGGSKAKKVTPEQAEINAIKKDIKAQLKLLKNVTSVEAALNYNIDVKEPSYKKAVDTAKTAKSDAEKSLNDLGKTEVTIGGNKKTISVLTEAEAKTLTGTDLATYKKYQKLAEDLVAGGKYDQDIKDAEAKKAEREQEIKEIQAEITKLQAELDEVYDEIEAEQDLKTLDKADGHRWQQTSDADMKEKYTFDTKTKTWNLSPDKVVTTKNGTKNVPYKVEKGDFKNIIEHFRGTMDENKKIELAHQYKDIWEFADTSIQNDKSLRNAYNIMYEYMEKPLPKEKAPATT